MKHFGLTLNLKNDAGAIASYKDYHRRVWPEVESALRRVGVMKMRIFLQGRRLFLYMETADEYDLKRSWAEYLREPRAAEWERMMLENFQEPLPEAQPGESWLPMEPIYSLD